MQGFCKKYIIIWVFLALAVVGITLGLVFGLRNRSSFHDDTHVLGLGAVVSNGEYCADIGGKMLRNGGSAVDAALATLICEGVLLPHSLGIGGGFVATVYTKETGNVETLIARETAPAKAHQDMFVSAKEVTGAISAAVPSEVYGYHQLHSKYGKMPWKSLFEPSIELCFRGFRVSRYLANVLSVYKDRIESEPSMAEVFINPRTNEIYQEGEVMKRPRLGETLKVIADEGYETIYGGGRIGKLLVQDIQEMGGIITEKDLQSYDVRWEEPIKSNFANGHTLYTTPLPTSGPVLSYMMSVLDPIYTDDQNVFWQRVVETFKHAYGHRTMLGDPHFEPSAVAMCDKLMDPQFIAETREMIKDDRTSTDLSYYGANFTNVEDHGTANIAVLGTNGDAITITSTINSHFGAKVRSRQTGIILNDEMDDFSTPGHINTYGIPASPANYIKPGKRPMSSMCPSIITDSNGKVQLLVGGAGGSKITTSVAQTILRYFYLNQTVTEAVNNARIHHQLAPMYVDVEPSVPEHVYEYLRSVGHDINFLPGDKAFSALTAIGLKTGDPQPVCDRRRVGGWSVVYPLSF